MVVGPVAGGEDADRRPARIGAAQIDLGHDDVGGAILVEQHPPPAAAAPPGLGDVEQQRIDARAGRPDIVDRAAGGAELGPGALPFVAILEAVGGRAGPHHRDDQHRRRAADEALHAEHLAGAGAVEEHAEARDIAGRADLLLLDDDPRDDPARAPIPASWAPAPTGRPWVRAQSIFQPCSLGPAPALDPRLLGALGGDVDLDSAESRNCWCCRPAGCRGRRLRAARRGCRPRREAAWRRVESRRQAGGNASRASFGELAVEIQAGCG